MRRIIRSLGVLALTGLVAAGCGTGPTKLNTAATVGDTTIDLGEFQQQIRKVIADKPAARQALRQRKMDQAARGMLTIRVQHELVRQVAAKQGLRGNPEQVSRELAQVPNLDQYLRTQVYDRAGFEQRLNDVTLLTDLARKQAPGLRLRADTVLVPDPARAKELARQVASQPARSVALMRGTGGRVGTNQTISPAQDLQLAAGTPLFGAREGSVVAYPAGGQNSQWYVARIRDRAQGPAGPAAARALQQTSPDALAQLGERLLAPYARALGVQVNPRYGVWDGLGLQLVASEGEKTAVSYPLRTSGASR